MKKFIFWVVFGFVALSVVIQLWGLAETHGVRVDSDIAKAFTLKKAGWKVPVLTGAMLPVQCGKGAGLGRRGQWVCANDFFGSAAATLGQKDIWGKTVGKNPCAFFREHIRLLEMTEFDSLSDWKSFKIGLAACMTV